jgi:Mg-chelatase subunit ChlD
MLTILPAAAQPVSLSLSQTWSDGPSVTFCLNPRGADGLPVKIRNPEVSATAGGRMMRAVEVKGFVASGEGVAYLVLADVSKSIGPAQFEGVRKAMANFAAGLRKVDRMALVTFGDEVRVALDFTADQGKIRQALDALRATGTRTKLHQALSRALEMGQREDAGLPRRRAIVVLTDGKDEGSGLNLEDLVNSIRAASIPVYAIGSSRLGEPEKKKYFAELQRLAANSGGDFFEASPSLEQSYETMRESVTGGLLARFDCAACPRTGRPEPWTITLKASEKVLTAGKDVLLPPLPPAVDTTTRPVAPVAPWWRRPMLWFVLVDLAAVVVVVVMVLRRGKRISAAAPVPSSEIPAGVPETVEPLPSPAPAPVRGMALELVTMHGMKRGETHKFELRGMTVVGRDAQCNLALEKETSLEGKQFELSLSNGLVVIRDVSGKGTTSVNGVPIRGVHPLTSGDVIGAGGAEFRLLIGKT